MKHVERKLRDKENFRSKILNAALAIAVKEGWEAVTIRRIADFVEYTTTVVYSHFKGKEELLNEVAELGFVQLYKKLEKIVSSEKSPREQLMKLSLANWDFALENKRLYELMFSAKRSANKIADMSMVLLHEIFNKISGEQHVDSYILNWICLRMGVINMLIMSEKDPKLGIISDPKRLYTEFITRFIDSIEK